jgi:hypothetical protein
VLLAGLAQKVAQGSSFTAILPTCLLGVKAYRDKGEIDWNMARWLFPGALVGVAVGAWGADVLKAKVLGWIFACFLMYAGLQKLLGRNSAMKEVPGTNGETVNRDRMPE